MIFDKDGLLLVHSLVGRIGTTCSQCVHTYDHCNHYVERNIMNSYDIFFIISPSHLRNFFYNALQLRESISQLYS
jgi:hypothetical protein